MALENDIFAPLEDDISIYRREFYLFPELWQKFHINDLTGIDYTKWKRIKLFQSGVFSSELKKIPTKYGGIYIYCVEPEIVPNTGCYVMYVGKASKTARENLRARIRAYQKQLSKEYTRDRLHSLFAKYHNYIYVHYLSIDADNETIEALETRLIAAFGKPPCNADVRVPSVNKAIKADF